jgi:hypothetical protein
LLKIRTDSYGEETYWEVRDDWGTVLEHGGNQEVGPNGGGAFPLGTPIGPGAYPSATTIRDTLELPASGCYSIHISDGYGDGICCNFGNGYYRLYNLDNPTIPVISGGEFSEYARRGFGAGVLSATEDLAQSVDIQLFPNPAHDFLNLSIDAPLASAISGKVYNAFGQLQENLPEVKAVFGGNDWQLALDGWPAGIYFLQLKIGAEMLTRSFVVTR